MVKAIHIPHPPAEVSKSCSAFNASSSQPANVQVQQVSPTLPHMPRWTEKEDKKCLFPSANAFTSMTGMEGFKLVYLRPERKLWHCV